MNKLFIFLMGVVAGFGAIEYQTEDFMAMFVNVGFFIVFFISSLFLGEK